MPRLEVELSGRAERDLRKLSKTDRERAGAAMTRTLAREPLPRNADDKRLRGREHWRRLRVGDLRILHRTFERRGSKVRLVARIVNRRDLERALSSLR